MRAVCCYRPLYIKHRSVGFVEYINGGSALNIIVLPIYPAYTCNTHAQHLDECCWLYASRRAIERKRIMKKETERLSSKLKCFRIAHTHTHTHARSLPIWHRANDRSDLCVCVWCCVIGRFTSGQIVRNNNRTEIETRIERDQAHGYGVSIFAQLTTVVMSMNTTVVCGAQRPRSATKQCKSLTVADKLECITIDLRYGIIGRTRSAALFLGVLRSSIVRQR